MFENIIDQNAVKQLQDDILSGCNAPSMLFYGPNNSGKGSAALELARVLSCEQSAIWKCSCYSCTRHRYLIHDDILILGNKSFSAEIAACRFAFLNNHTTPNAKLLFYRSLRKLQIRFSPILMEDDPNFKKIAPVLRSFDEKLSEFSALNAEVCEKEHLEKISSSLVNDAYTLEKESKLGSVIPIDYIRRASLWCNLTPNGKHKILLIENADNMREEASNSLLKLLEEPPSTASIILTAQRREEIIPTILSRLRQYRFFKRDIKSEKEVIRLVFKDNADEKYPQAQSSLLTAYLKSFMPQSTDKIYPLAAWLIVSMSRIIGHSKKNIDNPNISFFVNTITKNYSLMADSIKLEYPVNSAVAVKTILAQAGNFKNESFCGFMNICLDMLCESVRSIKNPHFIIYCDIFKKYINETVTAVDILNININIAMEALFYNVKKAIN
ncbi:MAG: DNA polymerase III [Treponema sp.]|jgi:DNA polymerase-3 subunit gamma/tau|nr:DNA polymerase III [Treponema sp.]